MKYMIRLTFFLSFLLLVGCETSTSLTNVKMETICGRDSRTPLYRAKVPLDWKRKDPPPTQSLTDTMLPLCEFFIENAVRITIHNFPNQGLETRIPPLSQITRWKKQFQVLDPLNHHTQAESWGGFVGLQFDGSGILDRQEVRMLGWSLQLAAEHFLTLEGKEDPYFRQALADYTIKALGPKELVEKYHSQIEEFAHSFELIREIPQRT
jgi:hypothetical protein